MACPPWRNWNGLHEAERAADAQLDAESLALLGQAELTALRLELRPAVRLVDLCGPVAGHPELVEACLVWREGWAGQHATVDARTAGFMRALLKAESLGAALDAAAGEKVCPGRRLRLQRVAASCLAPRMAAPRRAALLNPEPGPAMKAILSALLRTFIHPGATVPDANLPQPVGRILVEAQSLALLGARLYLANVFFSSGLTKLRDWSSTLALFQDIYNVPVLPRCWPPMHGHGGRTGVAGAAGAGPGRALCRRGPLRGQSDGGAVAVG